MTALGFNKPASSVILNGRARTRLHNCLPSPVRVPAMATQAVLAKRRFWGCKSSSAVSTAGSASLHALCSALDRRIIGHEAEKEAVLLALVAREHVYIEGPPGVAKTLLAETAAQSTGLSFFFYQMHRDTKLHELIGDAVIMREPLSDGGEAIRSFVRPGGILTSELCVLDDISRAPGEALNVLLRLLNERQYCGPSSRGQAMNLPLRTAIATSNSSDPGSRYYIDPLDPANLDRFVLQLKTDGALSGGRWDEVSKIIDLFSEVNPKAQELEYSGATDVATDVATNSLESATEAHAKTTVPPIVRRLLLEVLRELTTSYGLTQKNSLLTDRTFLVKTLKVMRAKAVLHGRQECSPSDLLVLSYLTTFRIPEQVHQNIDSIICDVLKRSGFSNAEESFNASKLQKASLERMSIRALRHECYLKGVDISRCFEKEELIDRLLNPISQECFYNGLHDSH